MWVCTTFWFERFFTYLTVQYMSGHIPSPCWLSTTVLCCAASARSGNKSSITQLLKTWKRWGYPRISTLWMWMWSSIYVGSVSRQQWRSCRYTHTLLHMCTISTTQVRSPSLLLSFCWNIPLLTSVTHPHRISPKFEHTSRLARSCKVQSHCHSVLNTGPHGHELRSSGLCETLQDDGHITQDTIQIHFDFCSDFIFNTCLCWVKTDQTLHIHTQTSIHYFYIQTYLYLHMLAQ